MSVHMERNGIKRNNEKKRYGRHAVVIRDTGIKKNYTWLAGLAVVFLMGFICSAVYKASGKLEQKNAEYDKQIEALNTQIEEQEKRREDLETRSVYITTKQFIEEFAREKLGLVFGDELIFRSKEEEE